MVDGIFHALSDFTGALVPLSARSLREEVDDRLARIPNRLNEYGFDPYGFSPESFRASAMLSLLLYRHYFRCDVFDADRMPEGRVLVIANHAGQLPFDGMMLSLALLLEAEPPRIARSMAEYFVSTLPFVSVGAARGGAMVGTPENCVHMLEHEECVVAFPEGVRGMNKLYRDRYVLQRFGHGFMRLALETNTPIVPVGIVGSEEQNPGLANLERAGRAVGLPALPITWAFPWLGPAGMLPLPVKYRIYFGEPMLFEGDANEEDAVIADKVERVKARIDALLQRGLRERTGIFL